MMRSVSQHGPLGTQRPVSGEEDSGKPVLAEGSASLQALWEVCKLGPLTATCHGSGKVLWCNPESKRKEAEGYLK